MLKRADVAEISTTLDTRSHLTELGFEWNADLSYGDSTASNAIIHAGSLLALDALRKAYECEVRLIYIDPPYNNQENYRHYLDRSSHETWLSQMEAHLCALAPFLSEEGSIWISIDDNELHYLKVAADKIFGRDNFLSTIVWQHRTTRENRKVFSNNNEFILAYAKNARVFREHRNMLPTSPEFLNRFRNPDNDPRGPWQSVSANVQAGHGTASQFYELVAPVGKRHVPPNGRCWIYTKVRMQQEIAKNNIWFGRDGTGVPRIKHFLAQANLGLTPHTLWGAEEVGTTDLAKKHLLRLLPNEQVFDTPKPESLLSRILGIATNPGDLVLDTFLGSATTAAAAHKMGRRYLGVECGDHAVTHCVPRLRRVVDGEQGGISAEFAWKGGGGFSFFGLKPTAESASNGHRLIASNDRRKAFSNGSHP